MFVLAKPRLGTNMSRWVHVSPCNLSTLELLSTDPRQGASEGTEMLVNRE